VGFIESNTFFLLATSEFLFF